MVLAHLNITSDQYDTIKQSLFTKKEDKKRTYKNRIKKIGGSRDIVNVLDNGIAFGEYLVVAQRSVIEDLRS